MWLFAGAGVLLVLSAALVLLLPQIRQKHPGVSVQVQLTPTMMRTLEIREPSELESAVIAPSSGESYTLVCQNGKLYLQENDGLHDISDVYHDELLQALTQIVVQETAAKDASEVEEHLADMGLAPARASAVLRYRDGSEATLEIGAPVPHTTYAYYRWSGDPGVHMCDVGIAEAFALTKNHLLPIEQPVVYASLVRELRLVNANGESCFTFTGSAEGTLTDPFAYPLSADAASQLTTALQNLRLGTREADITEENRAKYGFDAPLCVIEMEQKSGFTSVIGSDGSLINEEIPARSLRFTIGRAESDYFYTCEYEGSCYLVSRFLVQQLVEADAESLITRTPAAVNGSLAALRIEVPTGTLDMTVTRTERVLPNNELELDENGNPVYDAVINLNGKAGTQEQLDEMTDRLNTFAISGSIPEDAQMADSPRWSICIETEDGAMRQIDAYRMDAFSDALSVDGVMRHYIHSDAIETLVSGFLPVL